MTVTSGMAVLRGEIRSRRLWVSVGAMAAVLTYWGLSGACR